MAALVILLAVLFIVWIVFVMMVLPVWSIVHCALKPMETHTKTLWIIAMVLTGPIGCLLYGFLVSEKRFFRWNAVVSGALLLIVLAAAVWSVGKLGEIAREQAVKITAAVTMDSSPDLSPQERTRLRLALSTLSEETQGFWAITKIRKSVSLMRILSHMMKDSKMTPEEFRDWTGRFDGRELTDEKDLERDAQQISKTAREDAGAQP